MVESDLSLPELPPWAGPDREPDVSITRGPVPPSLDAPRREGPFLQIAGSVCRYEIPGIAAYLIRDGREVIVQASHGVPNEDVRTFLFGTVLALLSYQRACVPLHASCVVIDGRAIAIAGPAGAGKSTMAALAWRAGHRVLSDDVTILDVGGAHARVLPTVRQLVLAPDVAEVLCPDAPLEPRRSGLTRRTLPLGEAFCDEPLNLAAVVHLSMVNERRLAGCRALDAIEATARLHDQLHTARYGARAETSAALLARLAPLANGAIRHVAFASFLEPASLDLSALTSLLRGLEDAR